MTFEVQEKSCSTCIYRKDSLLDIKKLEADVADRYGWFRGYRVCHQGQSACCRGFWNRHKNQSWPSRATFGVSQIRQR